MEDLVRVYKDSNYGMWVVDVITTKPQRRLFRRKTNALKFAQRMREVIIPRQKYPEASKSSPLVVHS
jgi:hypothetical protein